MALPAAFFQALAAALSSPRCSGSSARWRQALARSLAAAHCWLALVSNCWDLPHNGCFRQAMPARYCSRESRGWACWADSMRASQAASSASSPAASRVCTSIRACWSVSAPGCVDAQFGPLALGIFQPLPDLLQLRAVARAVDQFGGQAAHQTLCGVGRDGAVLAQQARGVERLLGLARQPRGSEFDAQRQRAPRGALRQGGEPFERGVRIALVERP